MLDEMSLGLAPVIVDRFCATGIRGQQRDRVCWSSSTYTWR